MNALMADGEKNIKERTISVFPCLKIKNISQVYFLNSLRDLVVRAEPCSSSVVDDMKVGKNDNFMH